MKFFSENLIRNAKELKEAGKYKNALSQLAKARDLGVAEALNQIRDLEKEIARENFMPIDLLTKENIEFYYNLSLIHILTENELVVRTPELTDKEVGKNHNQDGTGQYVLLSLIHI